MAQILDCAITKKYIKNNRIFYGKCGEMIANTSQA